MSQPYYLQAYLTSSTISATLGVLPARAWVSNVRIHVTQAFNATGTDQITVGHSTDDDAYCTATDVSSTGIKTITLGAGVGYDATARKVVAAYAAGSGAPTTGKAYIILEYFLLSRAV